MWEIISLIPHPTTISTMVKEPVCSGHFPTSVAGTEETLSQSLGNE